MNALMVPRIDLALIQPTPLCNLDCKYCYLPFRHHKRQMALTTLEKIAERLFESPFVREELTIVWHAGEPLILPIAFYEAAHEIFRQHNPGTIRLTFSFQTNATLIDDAWCQFFKDPDIRVGVSLDGPQEMHDAQRVDRAGHGTFVHAFRGLKLLQQAGLHPSIIAVVTRQTLPHAETMWNFFSQNHLGLVGFNPEETEGVHTWTTLDSDADVDTYRQFLLETMQHGAALASSPRLREQEAVMTILRSASRETRSQESAPFAITSFDVDGNISTFSPELLNASHAPFGDFIFGNVFHHRLEDILVNPKFCQVAKDIEVGIEACRQTCEYFTFCGGGAPSNKIAENGSFATTETYSCRLRIKATVDAVLDFLEEQE